MSVQIFNEDCLETMSRIESGSIDLVLQDTPFNTTQNDWDNPLDFGKLWPEWLRIGKPNCPFIFFGAQPFTTDLINSNRKMFKYDMIWYKPLGSGHLNAKKMPMRNHEHIIVFYQKPPTYNPIMGIGIRKKGVRKADRNGTNYGKFAIERDEKFDDEGKRFPQSVIEFTNGDRTIESDHPTQKSLDLIRYLVTTYSNPGDTVFDGYSGSGTTAVASFLEGRSFIGSENDIKHGYFDTSIRRLNAAMSQQSLFTAV